MKKVLFGVIMALTVTSAAHAQRAVATRVVWEDLKIRTFAAAYPNGGYVDSTVFSAVGVESNAAAPLDTSIAYSTQGWARRFTNTATDTLPSIIVVIGDAAGQNSAAACDSLGIAVQVSHDGQRWATATTFAGGTNGSTITTGNNQAHVNGVFQEQLSVNAAGVTPHMWVFQFKDRGASGMAQVDIGGLLNWPFIRFVVRYADGVDGYILSGKVGHLEAVEK